MMSQSQSDVLSSLKKHIEKSPLDSTVKGYDLGCILNGYALMYKLTGDKFFFDQIKSYIDSVSFEKGNFDVFYLGLSISFIFDETKEDKYKDLAFCIKDRLLEFEGYIQKASCSDLIESIKEYMPFYVDFETRWNKKNGYNDICDKFKNAAELISRDKTSSISLEKRIGFLKTLVDSLSVLSIQIYEDYRLLEDILRQGIKELFFGQEDFDKALSLDCTDKMMSAYILYRSIKEGHVDAEKYESLARLLYDSALQKEDYNDPGYVGAFMMATAFCEEYMGCIYNLF